MNLKLIRLLICVLIFINLSHAYCGTKCQLVFDQSAAEQFEHRRLRFEQQVHKLFSSFKIEF